MSLPYKQILYATERRMKQIQDIQSALSSFKVAAATQAAATEEGDNKKGNKAFNQIIRIIKYLKGIDKLTELEAYLYDSNVGVRMFAAYGLLQVAPELVIPVFKEIAQRDDIHSLTAKMTLKQWEEKKLAFPF